MMSIVIIAPVAASVAANALAAAVSNWGTDNLTIPLSASGAEPVTHYACRAWDHNGNFVARLAALQGGALPDGWTQQEVAAALAPLTIDHKPKSDPSWQSPRQHLLDVIGAASLSIVDTPAP